MAKRKRTNHNLQSTTHKSKDRVTRTTLNTGDELMCSGRVSSSYSASGTRRVTLVTSPPFISAKVVIKMQCLGLYLFCEKKVGEH